MAGGLYLPTLAAAILSGSLYARWLGWASAGARLALARGIVLELWSPAGTALNLVGVLLFLAVLVGLGVSMWRKAAFHRSDRADTGAVRRSRKSRALSIGRGQLLLVAVSP